jgi:integrase
MACDVTVKGRGRRFRKRHVPLSAPVAAGVYDYLMSRGIKSPQDAQHADEPLVMARDGRAWKRTGLSGLMARIGQEAGITRFRVSAHKLRHTASVVTRLARLPDGSKLDPWTRSQLLSHVNPTSLNRYEHLLPDELFEAREAHRAGLARYLGGPAADGPASGP